jgi:hypothetical protein
MALMTVDDEGAEGFRTEPRWSAGRKMDVVLRLLRGEKLEELSRELGVVGPAVNDRCRLRAAETQRATRTVDPLRRRGYVAHRTQDRGGP